MLALVDENSFSTQEILKPLFKFAFDVAQQYVTVFSYWD
jgi:hypothetical protein